MPTAALLRMSISEPAPRRSEPYAEAGQEPPLRELLADPIVHAVMRRDRIGADDVWGAVHAARAGLASRGMNLGTGTSSFRTSSQTF